MIEVELYSDKLEEKIKQLRYCDLSSDRNIVGIDIPESDYGFAEIYRFYDDIFIFVIPQYGGTPSFLKSFDCKRTKDIVEYLRKL